MRSRNSWKIRIFIGLAIATFFVAGGYMEAWQDDRDLDGWFAGLIYAWATMPLAGTFLAMNQLTAVPSARREGLRSELLVVAGAEPAWDRAIAFRPDRVATLAGLGVTGALFMVLYVVFLGTDGTAYEFMRRYGVTVYFSFTALAQLLLAARLRGPGPEPGP